MKLIICTLIIMILFISCSAKATAPANFSETDTTTQPEEKPSNPEQKPEVKPEPAMKVISGRGAGQFAGKIFEDSTLRAEVKNIGNEPVIFVYDGNIVKEYGCGIPVGGSESEYVTHIQYRLTPRDHSYSLSGTATFREEGYLHLSIGGKNQALKLVK